MGYYTTLEFKVIVKDEYVPFIPQWNSETDTRSEWEHGPFAEFGKVERSSFIPFGAVEGHRNEVSGNEWTVRCALKDYDEVIKQFAHTVAVHMFESVEYFFATGEDYYSGGDGDRVRYLFDHGEVTTRTHTFPNNYGSFFTSWFSNEDHEDEEDPLLEEDDRLYSSI
jgi:hypothetical protein